MDAGTESGSFRVRAKDLDDLQSICGAGHHIDRVYLSGRMQHLGIIIPKPATHFLPDWLLQASRETERAD